MLPILGFKSPILAFLEPNLYYEIELWKHHHFLALCCENFGIKAFIKLNNENAINILAFKRRNLCNWVLWNWPLVAFDSGGLFWTSDFLTNRITSQTAISEMDNDNDDDVRERFLLVVVVKMSFYGNHFHRIFKKQLKRFSLLVGFLQ